MPLPQTGTGPVVSPSSLLEPDESVDAGSPVTVPVVDDEDVPSVCDDPPPCGGGNSLTQASANARPLSTAANLRMTHRWYRMIAPCDASGSLGSRACCLDAA